MIALLDTSTGLCKLTLVNDHEARHYEWQADRELALGLLNFLEKSLQEANSKLDDLSALAVYRGPGSYTGLRIGITVWNTLADTSNLPIVGASGEDWQELALNRLANKENDNLVMPEYGGEANITAPRK